MMRVWIICVLCVVLGVKAVGAQQVEGADASAFQAARAAWLAGEDDLSALRLLNALAQADNRAAQILLARIAERAILHRHVTGELSRQDRMLVLRRPGGLSGQSWLTAAQDDPLAATFQTGAMAAARHLALPDLLAAKEWAAALIVAEDMVNRRQFEPLFDALHAHRDVAPRLVLDVLARADWLAGRFNARDGGAVIAALSEQSLAVRRAALIYRPPSAQHLLETPAAAGTVADLAARLSAFAPLRQFCARHCGERVDICLAIGVSATHVSGALPFRSPTERLIPQDLYWTSARMDADVRRILTNGLASIERLRPLDACLADTLAQSSGP